MSHLSLDERVSTAHLVMSALTSKPTPLGTIAKRLGKSRNNIYTIFKKLRKANLVVSEATGVSLVPGATWDLDLLEQLYNKKRLGDVQQTECTICKELKTRIFKGRDSTGIIYHDEWNDRWWGKKCPDCWQPADAYFTEEEPEPLTNRECRGCKVKLPQSRYLKCYTCQPDLPSVDEEYMFHGEGSVLDVDFGDLDHELD